MEEKKNDKNFKKQFHKKGKVKPKKPEYVPPYSAEILASSIDVLALSEGVVKVLKDGGVDVIGKIVTRTAKEMFGVQRFNKKHLFELTGALKAKGLDFKPAPQEVKSAEGNEVSFEKNRDVKQPKQTKREEKPVERPVEKKDKKQENKKGKEDAAFDVYKIFPRKPFVPTPPYQAKTDRYVKFQRGGKWGFRDQKGKEVIPPIYDEVFSFKEDMACVERNQAFGFINRENELVIPYKYDCASSFSEGLACVSLDEKCGYIDKTGAVVIPFVYDAGTAFVDKTARVKQGGKWGSYSLETKEVDWNN